MQARAITVREDGRQNLKGCGIGVGRLWSRIDGPDSGKRHVGSIGLDQARLGARRLDRALHDRHRAVKIPDVGEILIDPAIQLAGLEGSGHDQRRGGRAVVGLVKGAGVVDGGGVQLLDRADHAAAIDAFVEAVVADHEPLEPTIGRGIDPLAQLLLHDVAFVVEGLHVHHRPGHPLGVSPQDRLQILGRHGLVIVGEILARRGVARAASIGHQGGDLAIGGVHRLAAEDVFEQVGEA